MVGEYYIAVAFTLCGGKVLIKPDWFPHEFIRIALERGHITRSMVTQVLPASCYYDSASIREHAAWIYAQFPSESKSMINHHIGWWGRSVSHN